MKEIFIALLDAYGEELEILTPTESFDAVYGDETAVSYATGLATGVFYREESRYLLETFGDVKPADAFCVVEPEKASIGCLIRRDTEEFEVIAITALRWKGEKVYEACSLKKR